MLKHVDKCHIFTKFGSKSEIDRKTDLPLLYFKKSDFKERNERNHLSTFFFKIKIGALKNMLENKQRKEKEIL